MHSSKKCYSFRRNAKYCTQHVCKSVWKYISKTQCPNFIKLWQQHSPPLTGNSPSRCIHNGHVPLRLINNWWLWPHQVSKYQLAYCSSEGITISISFIGKKVKAWVCTIHVNFNFPFKLWPKVAGILHMSVYYTRDSIVLSLVWYKNKQMFHKSKQNHTLSPYLL